MFWDGQTSGFVRKFFPDKIKILLRFRSITGEDGISRKYLGGKPVMKMSFDYSKQTKAVTTNKLKPNRKIKNSYNLDKS